MNKVKKHHPILSIMIATCCTLVVIIIINWSVIFQKGNPIPYVKSILQLNDDQTYIQVQDDNSIIFITKRADYDKLHKYIEDYYDVSFKEQMGSGYIFRSDEKAITVSSEIYWKYFVVWTVNQ